MNSDKNMSPEQKLAEEDQKKAATMQGWEDEAKSHALYYNKLRESGVPMEAAERMTLASIDGMYKIYNTAMAMNANPLSALFGPKKNNE